MVKCKLDDWYVCMPFGSKVSPLPIQACMSPHLITSHSGEDLLSLLQCTEGKFHDVRSTDEDYFDFDEEEE